MPLDRCAKLQPFPSTNRTRGVAPGGNGVRADLQVPRPPAANGHRQGHARRGPSINTGLEAGSLHASQWN